MKAIINMMKGKQAALDIAAAKAENGVVKTGAAGNMIRNFSREDMATKTGSVMEKVALNERAFDRAENRMNTRNEYSNSFKGKVMNGVGGAAKAVWNTPGEITRGVGNAFRNTGRAIGGLFGNRVNGSGVMNSSSGNVTSKLVGGGTATAGTKPGAGSPKPNFFGKFTGSTNMMNGAKDMFNTGKNMWVSGDGKMKNLQNMWEQKDKFMPGLKTFGKGFGRAALIGGGTMLAGKALGAASNMFGPRQQPMTMQQPMMQQQPYMGGMMQPMMYPQPMMPINGFNPYRRY